MSQILEDITASLSKAAVGFDAEKAARNWQLGATRALRAQERLVQGLVSALRLEFRFGQELLANRVSLLTLENAGTKNVGDYASGEFEKLTVLVKDLTEELQGSFTEALKLLQEGAILAEPKVVEPAPVEVPVAKAPVVKEPVAEAPVEAAPAPEAEPESVEVTAEAPVEAPKPRARKAKTAE